MCLPDGPSTMVFVFIYCPCGNRTKNSGPSNFGPKFRTIIRTLDHLRSDHEPDQQYRTLNSGPTNIGPKFRTIIRTSDHGPFVCGQRTGPKSRNILTIRTGKVIWSGPLIHEKGVNKSLVGFVREKIR